MQVQNAKNLAYVTQTTLSVDDTARIIAALKERFPEIKGPKKDDICYATQNRQDAVKRLAKSCDVVLVVGSQNSSNSTRLREVAASAGAQAYMIDGPDDIERGWLVGAQHVGVTAGASAPEILVQRVIQRLQEWDAKLAPFQVEQQENVFFSLPKELVGAAK